MPIAKTKANGERAARDSRIKVKRIETLAEKCQKGMTKLEAQGTHMPN